MKVLAFNGSARKDGNTSILIQTVFAELNKQGIVTEEIHVGNKQLQGCLACNKCWENKNGHCILNNDPLNSWLDKMCAADGIILASPVYCADLSAQIKAFIDRASMVMCANNDMLQRKVGASIVAVRRAGALPTFHSLNSFFTIGQMIIVGSSYWNLGFGLQKNDVKHDAEGLQTMRNLGLNMAWLLHSLAVSKNKVEAPNLSKQVLTNFIRTKEDD